MIEIAIFAFITSTILSLIATPLVMRLASFVGAVDQPDARKIHSHPMPRLGGIAAFVSFSVTLVALHSLLANSGLAMIAGTSRWAMLAASLTIIVTLGACDDIWTLKPGQKFLVQVVAGSLTYIAGFRIDLVTNPISGGTFSLGVLSFPITIIWVVGITNAFNLIDGLDGLASGIALIASLTISSIAFIHHDVTTAFVALALSGSLLGFLRYNFNPARVFLGDSGSLFLGFLLAILSIKSATKGTTAFSVIVPFLALGVPIMDTTLAMSRRILRSFLPGQLSAQSSVEKVHSMFLPDKRHIHHQLLALGLSHRDAVIVLYVISVALSICAFLVTAGSLNSMLILLLFGFGTFFTIRKLGYHEMAIVRNGLLLRFYSKAFLKHTPPLVLMDTISIAGAIVVASMLIFPRSIGSIEWRGVVFAAVMVWLIQLTAFSIGGLYKRSITLLGLGDLLQILKSSLIAVAGVASAAELTPFFPRLPDVGTFLVVEFYLLVTLVAGTRVAFHAMNYVSGREQQSGGMKSLIYGANRYGLLALQALLSQRSARSLQGRVSTPIGFLDDDPGMEGKVIDGYPVFGGHWKLEGLLKKMKVDEVVVADDEINKMAFKRVMRIAAKEGVQIRTCRMRIENLNEYSKEGSEISVGNTSDRTLNPRAA